MVASNFDDGLANDSSSHGEHRSGRTICKHDVAPLVGDDDAVGQVRQRRFEANTHAFQLRHRTSQLLGHGVERPAKIAELWVRAGTTAASRFPAAIGCGLATHVVQRFRDAARDEPPRASHEHSREERRRREPAVEYPARDCRWQLNGTPRRTTKLPFSIARAA